MGKNIRDLIGHDEEFKDIQDSAVSAGDLSNKEPIPAGKKILDKETFHAGEAIPAKEKIPVWEVIGKKRSKRQKEESRRRRLQGLQGERGILLIPIVIVVLTIVILILDRNSGDTASLVSESRDKSDEVISQTDPEPSAMGTETEAVTETVTETEPQETEDPTLVREYYDDVLVNFFQRFFDAKLSADVETLYNMSDVTRHTSEEKERLRSQLKVQSGYIEAYQDIRTYAVSGLEKNSRLVFLTYNVKFRRANTLAPAVMYCYVIVNSNNEFQLIENMTPTQVRWINNYMTRHEEVKELVNATNSRLLEALSSDTRLAVIYDAFQTGRIYTEEQESIDSEVSLIGARDSQ